MAVKKSAARSTTSKRTTRKSTPVKTNTKKTRTKKTVAAAVAVEPVVRVVTPILPTTPVVTQDAPITNNATGYKHVKEPVDRAKVWFAVTVCSVIIASIWAYSLSQRLIGSHVVDDSVSNTGIDAFMQSISEQWNSIQDSANSLSNQLNGISNTNTAVEQTPAEVPSNANTNNSLDNLFSDL